MDPTYDDVARSIGSFLMVWAGVERSLICATAMRGDCAKKKPRSFSDNLQEWEALSVHARTETSLRFELVAMICGRLRHARTIRNGICHGLNGMSAGHGSAAAKITWTLNGADDAVAWSDMQDLLAWLSKLPQAIDLLGRQRQQNRIGRLIDNPENRDWWFSEFGLDLR